MQVLIAVVAVFFAVSGTAKTNKNDAVAAGQNDIGVAISTDSGESTTIKEAPVIIDKNFLRKDGVMPWEKRDEISNLISNTQTC